MEIRSKEAHLAMRVIERLADNLPTPGDTQFEVEFVVEGLEGYFTTLIAQDQLTEFANQLRVLHSRCQGSASIASISPGQFRLQVADTDLLGHMSLKGGFSRKGQSAEFSFSFDQTEMLDFVKGFDQLNGKLELT